MKTVGEYIVEWLDKIGADGLCCPQEGCCCAKDKTFTHYDCCPAECVPAKLVTCPRGHTFFAPMDEENPTCIACEREVW